MSKLNFNELYRKFWKPIVIYIKNQIPGKDEGIAEEIAQEVFMKIHKYMDTYKDSYAITTWIWAIAKNTIIDWKRSQKVWSMSYFDEEILLDTPCNRPNAENALFQNTERNSLRRAFMRLTTKQYRVLILRINENKSMEEIAKALNVSVGSVKCLIYRAKATLINTPELRYM